MSEVVASGVFYGMIAAFVYFLYQAAILPGIRQMLRFEIFKLRDNLRSLVVEGVVKEQNDAVVLLEDHLNFMLSNLPRFDAYSAFRALRSGEEKKSKEMKRYLEVMANAPNEVRVIYEGSLKTFMKAMAFNSFFVFAILTFVIVTVTLCRVGALKVGESVRAKAQRDAQLAFFRCSEAVV
jgi:hypothetical protein